MTHAYMTLLCNGDGYVTGAEVLGKSLAASHTRIPRLALITADISDAGRARLAAQGWELRLVELIANPTPGALLVFPRFASVSPSCGPGSAPSSSGWCLDADTLVLHNIDELFNRKGFAAAPDFFLPDRFNSGVMVLEPSLDIFHDMVESLARAPGYDSGDQGFLNSYYPDWYSMPAEHRLPIGYNVANFIYQFAHGHPLLREALAREAKILHYMVQKPWQARATLTGGSEVWWNMYFEAHPEKAHRWREHAHAFEDWTFDKLAAMLLD